MVDKAAPQYSRPEKQIHNPPRVRYQTAAPEAIQQALQHPSAQTLTPQVVQALQRTHGNHFIQRLLRESNNSSPSPRRAKIVAVHPLDGLRLQRVVQFLLTPDEFGRQKTLASSKKGKGIFKKKRSTSDYKKLYKRYDNAVKKRDFEVAATILKDLEAKIGRMTLKTYWVAQQKDAFFNLLRAAYDQEKAWLSTQQNQKEGGKASGAIEDVVRDVLVADFGLTYLDPERQSKFEVYKPSDVENPKLITSQRAMMLNEALVKAVTIDPRIKATVLNSEFIRTLWPIVIGAKVTTFLDVLNIIATLLPKFASEESKLQPQRMDEAIDQIVRSSLTPTDKIVQVGQLLWGSFDWYVNSDDIRYRDPDQKDQFILWAMDKSNRTREPSGGDKMNCWEGVLFVLCKAGRVSKATITSFYNKEGAKPIDYGVGIAYQLLAADQQTEMYAKRTFNSKHPKTGDIVHMWSEGNRGEPQHAVLVIGQNSKGEDECLSLWSGGTAGMLGRTTVQQLEASGNFVRITFSTPTIHMH